MTSVRLTVGQKFKFYYDYDLYSGANTQLVEHLKKDKAFSYEVQNLSAEWLLEANDLLNTRLSIYDGDMLFTDDRVPAEDSTRKNVLAKSRVDATKIYIMKDLHEDAKAYLRTMLKDGFSQDKELEFEYSNLDEQKIEQGFHSRLGKDNRFRTAEQKAEGIRLEKERIQRLCQDVKDFKKILELPDEYFFCYTRFSQKLEMVKLENDRSLIETYQKAYDTEINTPGRVNARYGLRVDMLKQRSGQGKKDPTEFFNYAYQDPASSNNVMIMVFDLQEQQPELQFECISVINSIVRACSTILD